MVAAVTAMAYAIVPCAFCHGTGVDPFRVFSFLSACCVCGGKGLHQVKKPHVRCAFCRGTGVYPHSRLTCTACGGMGLHSAEGLTKACPNCHGPGVEPTSTTGLYCLVCHGAGLVPETA